MLSNDEIRRRYFERGVPIDRHGNYVSMYDGISEGREGYCLLLHYHLINGTSDKDAQAKLKEFDLSPPEIAFLMQKTKTFISDVLGIDLEQVRSAVTSTDNYLYQEVNTLFPKIGARYETQRHADIDYNGNRFQADEKSRTSLSGYIQSGVDPIYWISANNTPIEPFTLDDVKALYRAIVQRDNELHMAAAVLKQKIRILVENKEFTAIKQLAVDEGL